MAAPLRTLETSAGAVELTAAPIVMGVLNATPDSFSDAGAHRSFEQRLALARSMCEAGAAIIDIGGESAVTNRPAVSAQDEAERVVALIEQVSSELDVLVSVDTYKPAVAQRAIRAGASIVNDTSGLRDPELADVCALTGAALVLMHTRAEPKQKLLDPGLDGTVLADVTEFLSGRVELALDHGMRFEQLLLDPGPDFSKTPAQTVEALRGLHELHRLGRPLLLAVSRKDFIGAITARSPRARLGGTLAAVAHGVDEGAHVLRVHDVPEVVDFLAVRAALRGDAQVDSGLRLPDDLRHQQSP